VIIKFKSPLKHRHPARGKTISLGIGMQALSNSIPKKVPR